MPGLKQDQLQSYVTQVLEAVVRRDKAALRLYGQRDGFINDRIRRLVWFPSPFFCNDGSWIGHVYLIVRTLNIRCTMTGLDSRT